MNQDAILQEERRYSNEYAPYYQIGPLSNSYVYQQERINFLDWVFDVLRKDGLEPEELRYLDLGCGPGTVIQLLAERQCSNLFGVDISEGMLQEGRRQVAGVRWVQGALERLPFQNASLDVVIAVFTLHHLADTRSLTQAIEQVLRKGGWCFILDYEASSPTFLRWFKGPLGFVVSPLRFLWKIKNARALRSLEVPIPRFTEAHRPRRFESFRNGLSNPGDWAIKRKVHGYLIPHLHHTLVATSAIDALALRATYLMDHVFTPLGPGHLQWIAMRRL